MAVVSVIIKFVLISRLLIIVIQCFFNYIIPNHEPTTGSFTAPGQNDSTEADVFVSTLFGGFKSWDAQYFLHVAKHGYTYENTLAFFPLYPCISYYISKPISLVLPSTISQYNCILLSGLILNSVCVVLTSITLYYLTIYIFSNPNFAYLTAVIFALNPASIFFSAFYSESLFCFLTFLGMLCLEKNNLFVGSALFGLSGGTRSNGIISCGFLIFHFAKEVVNEVASVNMTLNISFWLKKILQLSAHIFLCIVPFVSYQVYSCLLYCVPHNFQIDISEEIEEYAEKNNFVIPSGQLPSWCYHTLPLSYSYVQREYWNVGFLKYYHWKQIPNFILATPVVALILSFSTKALVCKLHGIKSNIEEKFLNFMNNKATVYAVHAACLTIFCVLGIHVQVTTRLMCSTSPIIYWSIATIIMPDFEKALKRFKSQKRNVFEIKSIFLILKLILFKGNRKSKCVLCYCLIYLLVGTVCFSNQFPWT